MSILCLLVLPGSVSGADPDSLGARNNVPERSWTTFVLKRNDLKSLPYHSIRETFFLFPSIVTAMPGKLGPAADGYHVRGGRPGEIAHFVDGLPVTNRLSNAPVVDPIPEAVESIELHVGPYSSAYGQGLSGLSMTRLRTGGENLEIFADYRTDAFAPEGKKFLGTSTFGYRSAVATIGGPIPLADTLRFFVAGRYHAQGNRQVMFLDPFRFDGLTEDQYGFGRTLPGPLSFTENTLPGNTFRESTVQGNVRLALAGNLFQFTGAYRAADAPMGTEWPAALYNYYNRDRLPEGRQRSALLGLTAERTGASTSIRASVSWQKSGFDTYDPDFGNDWMLYSDSIANAAAGRRGFAGRWRGPNSYSVIAGLRFAASDSPPTQYRKDKQQAWTISGELSQLLGNGYTLNTGISMEWWQMRYFEVTRLPSLLELLYGTNLGSTARVFSSDAERRVRMVRYGRIDNYGYTVDGDEAGPGVDEPRSPFFGSAFAELRHTSPGISVGLGFRYEHVALGMPVPRKAANVPYDHVLDAMDEEQFIDQPQRNYFLPRLDASYSPVPGTTIRGAYGQYIGVPPLVQIFHGTPFLNETYSPYTRGNAYLTPVGWEARPERCSSAEVSISHTLSAQLHCALTFYLKKYSDLLAIDGIWSGFSFSRTNALLNHAYANARGMELNVEYEHESGFHAAFRYGLSAVSGTDSYVLSLVGEMQQINSFGTEGAFTPRAATALDFQRTHRANMILGYRSPAQSESTIFTGLDFGVFFSYDGGHPYTRQEPISALGGSSTPWNAGVNFLVDPRFTYPAEPINSSRTPPILTIDLAFSKTITLGPITADLYVHVLNLLNTRATINVYPRTGTGTDDGWLESWVSDYYKPIPGYVGFYRAINLSNRWAYMSATGVDIYNQPRQVRGGIRISL
jgi:hypothetical protein